MPARRDDERAFKKPGGRPPKFTPELGEQICRNILAGVYLETAAALAGVHKDTLYDWLKKGAWYKQGVGRGGKGKRVPTDKPYAAFSDAVDIAREKAEARDVLTIGKVAEGVTIQRGETTIELGPNWKAAAWRLERRSPDRWGAKRASTDEEDEEEDDEVARLARAIEAIARDRHKEASS